jgi:hypothetical protein
MIHIYTSISTKILIVNGLTIQIKRQRLSEWIKNKRVTFVSSRWIWRVDYEKPMRTGHKEGEMQLNCFS